MQSLQFAAPTDFLTGSNFWVVGKVIESFQKISDCNIEEESTLVFRNKRSTEIAVKPSEQRQINLTVDLGETVEDVKKEIEKETGIAVKEQLLTFDGEDFNTFLCFTLSNSLSFFLHIVDFR